MSFHYLAAEENGFKADVLDNLLAAGYYRMQHCMFTCNDTVINESENAIPVFWLRTIVQDYKLSKSAIAIEKKCSVFSVKYMIAYVDDEIENLFSLYKKHVTFSVADSCNSYLHQQILPQPFTSIMVQIRHNNKLVAAGYFDEGNISIAGIMNIYHPEYNSYSLGKFLMLQKLKYASCKNMLYYYTGYISTQSTRFDYKIFPDVNAVEILLPVEQEWIKYKSVSKNFLADYYCRFLATV